MIAKRKTLAELSREAFRILCRELGPGDAIRYVNQFSLGSGDYTRDRHQWLGTPTVAEIAAGIEKMKAGRQSDK